MIEEYINSNIDGRVMPTSKLDELHFNCPFCDDNRMRMYVNLDSGKYHCHNCKVSGKTFHTFIAKLEGISADVVEDVYGVNLSVTVETVKLGEAIRGRLATGKLADVEKDSVGLPKGFIRLAGDDGYVAKRVKKYLYSRGVTNADIRTHGWGYCIEPPYENRAILTIYNGKRLDFYVARAINNTQKPKELSPTNTPMEIGKSEVIFNLDRAAELHKAVISEGIFDALAWGDIGIATLGKTCSEAQISLLLGVKDKLDEIVIALDADAKKEAIELAEQLYELSFPVSLLLLPCTDPNALLLKHGKEYCQSLLVEAKPYTRLSRVTAKLFG